MFGIVKSRVGFPVGFVLDLSSPILRIILRGRKNPQFHSKYSKFKMRQSLDSLLLTTLGFVWPNFGIYPKLSVHPTLVLCPLGTLQLDVEELDKSK